MVLSQVQNASLPKDQVLYAIGDVHGRHDLLVDLLRKIEEDAAETAGNLNRTLVFLGDYVDRGPASRQVLDILISKLPPGFAVRFVKGNHEAMLLDFLHEPATLDQWLANGGEATMRSYGVDTLKLRLSLVQPSVWRQAFTALLPDAHLRFLETLKTAVTFGDYYFVHAGVRPGVSLEAQDPDDLIWIRHEFLNAPEPLGKIVVHGHTPSPTPEIRVNRIGIDTGAVFTGKLTALRLEGSSRRFLQT